ncbi:MAG: hAT family dimerization domain-containing protein [Sweet potato little leaf phytoplasma]|nr:hAT family dimerization domain-containing protein [Sweet potato little leaf phytoplasma]
MNLSLSQPTSICDFDKELPLHDPDAIEAQFYAAQSSSQQALKSELDKYLKEDLEPFVNPAFNILKWWSVNSARFPVVSQMARDVLAIPISTVSSESAFSTGGRVLNDYRSSMSPAMVECLICLQDWIRKLAKHIPFEQYLREIEDSDKGITLIICLILSYFNVFNLFKLC